MAAAMANGITEIINAAKEPEVVQLCEMLNMGGAKIEGIGTDRLKIHGTNGTPLDFKEPIEIIPKFTNNIKQSKYRILLL